MNARPLALGLLALAGVLALASYRRAAALDQAAAPESDSPGVFDAITGALPSVPTVQDIIDMTQNTDITPNVAAFLETLSRCEGTANANDPYRVCYANRHIICSFAEHPAVSGEWRGEKLSDAQCTGVGLSSGCVSTAAGKYQITRPTWKRLRDKLGLSDFGPSSQDAAAVELLREAGALDLINAGKLADAVGKVRRIWASLPGANYAGQGMRSLAWVQQQYTDAGGVLA